MAFPARMRQPGIKFAGRRTLAAAVLLLPVVLALGGCGEGELFQRHNHQIESRANYFPDPHPIETTHQNYGDGGVSAMPFGSNGSGF